MKKISIISIVLISLMLAGASMQAAEPPASAGPKTEWQNMTAGICKSAGVLSGQPWDVNVTGMLILPNGAVAISVAQQKGFYRSDDQGATWTKWGEKWMRGDAQCGWAYTIHYPNRLSFFLGYGWGVVISSDGGETLVRFPAVIKIIDPKGKERGVPVDFGDMDLLANMPPKTVLGGVHHGDIAGGEWVMTSDSGKTWDWPPAPLKERLFHRVGVVDASTLLRGTQTQDKFHLPAPGIWLSPDLGKNWTKVSDYTLQGRVPVHYNSNIYWAAREGVVVSRDGGKTWSVCGSAVQGIVFGPYFGKSEQEMMVVSAKGFHITKDGGRSWTVAAPFFVPPAIPGAWEPNTSILAPETKSEHWTGAMWCFGWDAGKDLLYVQTFAGHVWKLQLGSSPAAR